MAVIYMGKGYFCHRNKNDWVHEKNKQTNSISNSCCVNIKQKQESHSRSIFNIIKERCQFFSIKKPDVFFRQKNWCIK